MLHRAKLNTQIKKKLGMQLHPQFQRGTVVNGYDMM